MYCTHCGKNINEKKLVHLNNTNKTIMYVCPRCGHLVKDHLDSEEIKDLNAAAHAEVHKAHNDLNRGKSGIVIGLILLCISFLFLLMCFKATAGGSFVANCMEFYVFLALATIGSAIEIFGIVWTVIGAKKKKAYQTLLKEVANGVFVQ